MLTEFNAALLGALLIGLSLGLLGSGGSILTVPVLIYLLHIETIVAIASSLAIVAIIACAACAPYIYRRQVQWLLVWHFALPGMIGTYMGAWLAVWVADFVQLLLFALVMLLAARRMIKPKDRTLLPLTAPKHSKIILYGLAIGITTGLVGVGGGFLIVPALVILCGLSMPKAVASSLAIIALQSSSGFIKYLDVLQLNNLQIDWAVIGLVAGVGIIGSWLGAWLSPMLPQKRLQQGFGIALIFMAVFIIADTVFNLIVEH